MSETAQLPIVGKSRLVALCDAADLPLLSRWKWRYERTRRGVITAYSEGAQMKATAALCPAWYGVGFANGNMLDLRRANLVRFYRTGKASIGVSPYRFRNRLFITRTVAGRRFAATFRCEAQAASFASAVSQAPRERVGELYAALHRSRFSPRTQEQFFDGRDMHGAVLCYEDTRRDVA
jgi:hypothetical protein